VDTQTVVILDFGSQYTQLIARRIREQNVFSVVLPCTAPLDEIKAYKPIGLILSGGPSSVYDADAPAADPRILALGVPTLGVCYGLHFIVHHLGGKVRSAPKREYGHAEVEIEDRAMELFAGLPPSIQVWMSHGDEAEELPSGFRRVAVTSNALAGIANDERRIWAVQFHPEVHHTPLGPQLIANFLRISGARGDWTPSHFIESTVASIREKVGAGHVICGLSGGVDSSVAAMLVHRAIGDQLTCIFVNNAVLRKNEFQSVQDNLRDKLGLNIVAVNASARFLEKLAGVTDPEIKRKRIGAEFIAVFEDEAHRIAQQTGGVDWLVQGTLYPDVIESAGAKTGKAHVIKSHHNVGGLPERMKLKLLEPLRELFKDEVRKLGVELGLPPAMVYRHPFPGPGLGVRILGAIEKSSADLLRRADAIFIEELRRHDLYDKVSQAFAVFLPVRSVGVMGDARRYDYVIALRAVETIDFMTARWAHLPYEFLDRVALRIVNEVAGISRVVYDITGKPPATIEWE